MHSQTFTLQAEDVITMLWNYGAAPAITDLNGDGLLDVFVGGKSGYLECWSQDGYHSNSFHIYCDITYISVGTNAAPAFADLDGDGLIDLLIGEQDGLITHYEQSSPRSLNFDLRTSNFCSIDVGYYSAPTLTDFNGDGLLDLVVGAYGYAQYFVQQSVNSNTFILVDAQFVGTEGYTLTPTFTDLDGDGLLDMFVAFGTDKIKRFEQLYANTSEFQYVAEFDLGLYPVSYPAFADLDGDRKLDMLIGDNGANVDHWEVTFTSINQSCVTTANAESLTATSAILGGNVSDNNGHLIVHRGVCYSNTNVVPTIADSTAFMPGPGTSFSATVDSLSGLTTYYYRAFAISSLGIFYGPLKTFNTQFADEITSNFNSFDIGGNSAPAIADIDCDGLLDLLIGETSGNINHYEQDTLNSTSVTLISDHFNEINVGNYATPTISDIDGDGLLDLLVGEEGGNINHYEQDAFDSYTFTLLTTTFNNIDIGDWSAPSFTDLDGNGILDLMIGTYNGKIVRYIQLMSNSMQFILANPFFNGITVDAHAVPTFTDLEGDGKIDLLIGEYNGKIHHYEQEDINSSSFTFRTNSFNSIGVGHESKPMFTNLDGDGMHDLLIGEYGGNINHFKSVVETINLSCINTDVPGIVSETSATCGGNITDDNSHFILRRGVCYSTINATPTFADNKENMGSGAGAFSGTISGLSTDSIFYVRAFASSALGVFYGEVQTFPSPDKFAGTALEYDGINDYVQISINSPQTDYTYELFFKTTDSNAKISSVRNPSLGTAKDRNLYLENGNIFHRLWEDETIGSSGQNYADDIWHHVAVVVESGVGQRLYVDGNQVASGIKDQSDFDWDTSLDLGYSGAYFNGKIEEVRLWDVVRTVTQIRENMYLNLTKFETGLVDYWQFNDGSGTVLTDIMFNGHDGALMNMDDSDWIESTIPFGPGAADSQTETTGTVVFAGTDLSMSFNSQNGADITVTCIDTIPNTDPIGIETVFKNQYWVVKRFGTGTFSANVSFTINEDLTALDETYPDLISLYTRTGNTDTDWVHTANASTVDSANNVAVFNGITDVGQFIIVRRKRPVITALKSFDFKFITSNTGEISDAKSYLIVAKNLLDDLNIESPEGFKISLSEETGFSHNLAITPVNGSISDSIFVRFEPDTIGLYTGNIVHTSYAAEELIPLRGLVSGTDNFPGTTLEFDGIDDYVQININSPQTDYTYELFFKTTDPNAKFSSVHHPSLATANDRNLYLDNGNISHRLWDNETIASSGKNYADNTWHHVAVVVESGVGQCIYVDGEQVASGTKDHSDFDWDSSLDLGFSDGYFEGEIEEVRLWNIVRTETQIRESMYLPLTRNENGLISYWQFNDGNGTILSDIIFSNDGTLMNMDDSAWIESTIPIGTGVANSQTETAGMVDFTETGLSMFFNVQNGAEIAVTRIDTIPNINPLVSDTVFDSQYWVANRFGSGIFNTEITFTISENLTTGDEHIPSQIKLYTRPSNADTNWAFLTSATTVDAASNTATFSGITGFSQFILAKVGLVDNFPGTVLEFDGIDDHVVVNSTPELRPANNFTIEAWIKPNNIINGQAIMMHDENGGGNDGYALFILNGHAHFGVHNGSNQTIIFDEPLVENCWNHIAAVYDNSVLRIFVNGVGKSQAGSGDVVYSITDNVNIGKRGGTHQPNTMHYEGKLDEIRFWNVAHDSVQIRENMNLPISGQESGLVAYWQFNDGSGTTLSDIISDNNGILMNMDDSDWIESTIPFGPGISNSQTETAGTVDFTETGTSIFFNAQNEAGITVTRIDTVPNTIPAGPESIFDFQYWVVNRFGDGVFEADLTSSIAEDLTTEDENIPSQIKLYTRGTTADTSWALLTSASAVNAANNTATFNGITGFSQFIIARGEALPELSVDPSNQEVSASAGTIGFAVASDTSWTISESVGWFSIDPMNGFENDVIIVTYDQNISGIERIGEITVTAAGGLPEVVVTITQESYLVHTINLPVGWSGLSSYLIPGDTDIEDIFDDIPDELVIVIAEDEIFYPGYNINTIGNWAEHSAYKIKTNAAVSLHISGDIEENLILPLYEGWNLIPVVSTCTVDVVDLFAPVISDLIIVKAVAGWEIYWPAMGINSLGILNPGEAYYVLVSGDIEITFEACMK